MPVLTGSGTIEREEPLFFEHESNRAVRDGKWKLVALEGEPWELYDISEDRGETEDLARVYPRVASRLAAEWYAWAERAKVLPLGGWRDRGYEDTNLSMKQGEQLSPEKSTILKGDGFSSVVKVLEGPLSGVLLAQGDATNGFSVYMENDTLTLLRRRNGEVHRLSLEGLPEAPFTVEASLSTGGRAILGIDDRRMDTRFGGRFQKNPKEGLSAGLDSGDPVGDYSASFPFQGKLGFITVRGQIKE